MASRYKSFRVGKFLPAIYTPLKILYLNGDFNSTKKRQNGLLEAVCGHYVNKLTIL